MCSKYLVLLITLIISCDVLISENKSNISLNSNHIFLLDTTKKYSWENNILYSMIFTKYNYNENFLNSEILSFSWDSVNNKPIYKTRNIISYNDNKLMCEDLVQKPTNTDSTVIWINKSKTMYNYDDNLNLIEEINQTYEIVGTFEYWLNNTKITNQYDSIGRIIERLESKLKDVFNKDWIYTKRITYIYSDKDTSVEKLTQVWNPQLESWRKCYRNKGYFNEYDEVVLTFSSKSTNDSTDWLPYELSLKIEYWYNELGKKTLEFTSLYANDTIGYWVPNDSTFFYYDNNNNLIEKKVVYKGIYPDWRLAYLMTYIYDSDNNLIEYKNKSYESKTEVKYEYTYLKISPVNELFNTEKSDFLIILPNPAQDYINIIMNLKKGGNVKVYIYDLTMQNKFLINNNYYDSGTHNFIYNTGNLPSGTYFVELETDGEYTVKQLLIVK